MGSVGGEELAQHGPSICEENIIVSVRLRPLNEQEISRNDVSDWECLNDNTIIFRNNLMPPDRSMYPTAYTFDRVFQCDCSTRKVYEEAVRDVALSVVSGINSSIFAYGQTSSGKTFTMSGITEYTIGDIYDYVDGECAPSAAQGKKFSAMEIYNESVRDLLSSDSTPLRLLDDPERGTVVEKLTETALRDWDHLKELLSFCEAQRKIGETAMNEASSRSHQIIRMTIESSMHEFLSDGHFSTLTATVNFVDLAGSERASQSLSAGSRLKEGCHINRSLLTLGTVIRKLSKGRNGHVPFRDSKLTRILQSSLAGNARTAIICTMSPAHSHIEQSRNTLLFASCAKEVATNAQVNVVTSDKALVKHLQRELAVLKAELRNTGSTVASDSAALLIEKDLQIEELKKEIAKLTRQRDVARSQVEDLRRPIEDDESLMSTAHLDHRHPKVRVRLSFGDDHPTSDASDLLDYHWANVETSEAYPDCSTKSRNYSEERCLVFTDTRGDFQQKLTPNQGSIHKTGFDCGTLGKRWDEADRCPREEVEDFCKEVQCVDIDESSTSRHMGPDLFLPEKDTRATVITDIKNKYHAKQDLEPFPCQEGNELKCVQLSCSFPSSGQAYSWISPNEISRTRNLTVSMSMSCKESLATNLPLPRSENVKNREESPKEFVNDLTGRLKKLQSKISVLKNGTEDGRLLRKCSLSSVGTSNIDDRQVRDAIISNNED